MKEVSKFNNSFWVRKTFFFGKITFPCSKKDKYKNFFFIKRMSRLAISKDWRWYSEN